MNWTKADVSIRARFRHGIRLARIPGGGRSGAESSSGSSPSVRDGRSTEATSLDDGATILVSVSGGADSVALLDLAVREARSRRWRLHVLHVDHGWRPDSGDDARFVRELARSLGLPSSGYRIRQDAWDRSALGSREATARALRRRAARRLATRIGARAVLLGHNRDDQVETILLQLLRGTGLRGLVGMPPRRGIWVRPLLEVGREELREYLRRRQIDWREDSSNQDLRYLRNRLRHRLLPLIEAEIRPGAAKSLLRMADALRSQALRFDREVQDAWIALSPERDGEAIRLDRPKLANYDPDLVEGILQRAFRAVSKGPAQLGQAHLRALEQALRNSVPRQFDLPSGVRAFVNAREVRLVVTAGQKRTGPRPRLT